jgi:copper homeostasis protein
VTAANIGELVARTGAPEYHSSARAIRSSAMRHRPAIRGLETDWTQTDAERVRALVSALGQIPLNSDQELQRRSDSAD